MNIRTIRDHNAHSQRQTIEHLAHGIQHQVSRELAEVRNQIVRNTLHGARLKRNVNGNGNRHNQKCRHHDQVRLLDTLFHTQGNNDEHQRHEYQHPRVTFRGAVQEAREERAAVGKRVRVNRQERNHVFDNPTANNAVVRGNDERHQRCQNADKCEFFAICAEGANRGKARLAAKRNLKQQQGNTESES